MSQLESSPLMITLPVSSATDPVGPPGQHIPVCEVKHHRTKHLAGEIWIYHA